MPRTTDAPTDADLAPDALAHIRAWHWPMKRQEAGRIVDACKHCGQGWPCHAALLLAEIDRLRAALAEARPVLAAAAAVSAGVDSAETDEANLLRALDDALDAHARALAARDGADEAAAPPR